MSVQTKTFTVFGRQYRSRQFAAVRALELMAMPGDIPPCIILGNTEAMIMDGMRETGVWCRLDTTEAINLHVRDGIGKMPPIMVMRAITVYSSDHTFKFLKTWRGVKVPSRFRGDSTPVNSVSVDPLIAQLLQDGIATLRELEEYYSLEDAFKMFDVAVAKGVNQALANEDSMKKSKV